MARGGRVDFSDLERFRDRLKDNFNQAQVDAFIDSCAKELAARLLAKVIKRTPVGDYSKTIEVVAKRDSKKHKKGETYTKKVNPSGKVGGTLRRGWTNGQSQSASTYANDLKVHHFGDAYVIEITNPVEYAPYVEYGHRTRSGDGWVEGKFMLTISEREVQANSAKILEQKLKKKLGECFG